MKNSYELINQFFGGYYNQDTWDDFQTDDEILEQFVNKITDFGGKSFNSAESAREFLLKLNKFLAEKNKWQFE